jgi:hypothetical protein
MARLLAATAATIAATATLLVGSAAADPVENPHTFALPVTCEGGFTATIYPTGAAGHLIGTSSVGVLHGTTTPGGSSFTPGFDASELTSCTSAAEPGVTFHILFLPRGG